MRDRIPTKVLDNGAVRYAVYDENGAFLRYEYMLPADEPTDPGTPLSKSTIMSDDVEALIWGAAADRTPNDAFGKVSELYQHWWSVLHGEAYSYYEEVKTRLESRVNLTNRFAGAEYSSTLTVDKDTGELSLVNPKSLGYYGAAGTIESFCSTLANNAPCYLCITTTEKEKRYYYIPTGATYSTPNTDSSAPYTIIGGEDDDSLYIYLNVANVPSDLIASVVTSQRVDVPAGETTYVHSSDRNAYPDSGTVDGLTYKYLGVPFDNAKTPKGFKKIGEGKIAVNGSSCYLELEQNLNNYAIVIIDGNNLRGDRNTGTAAIITVISVASLTATSGSTMGKLLTAYSANSAWNNFSVAISGITNRACVYLWEDEVGSGSFIASKYLYFSSDYKLLDEATFTVWGFEK